MGQLPYLTVDNVKIPQSASIARMLAKRFNLAGGDEMAHTKCDVVFDTVNDMSQAFYKNVYFVPDDQKPAALTKFLAEEAPKHLGNIEKLIGMYGQNGHSVGGSVTWADLYVFDVISMLQDKDAKILDKFPNVAKVKKSVEAHPKVAAWLAKRPKTSF